MQQIVITGNLGGDPTTIAPNQNSQRGQYRFNVGVFNGTSPNGEKQTAWYTVFCPQFQWLQGVLVKGAKVTVSGKLSAGIFIGNDGQSRLDLTVNADAIDVHSSAAAQQGVTLQQGTPYNPITNAGTAVQAQAPTYRQPQAPHRPQPQAPVVLGGGALQQPQDGDLPEFLQ